MRYIQPFIILLILMIPVHTSQAQIVEGAKWTFTVESSTSTEAVLVFTADVRESFHIYSQFLSSEEGPIPTTFEFSPAKSYALTGHVEEEEGHQIFDEAFQMTLKTFEKKVVFRQKIKILSAQTFTVDGKLTYMACDNRMCLPPSDVPFQFTLSVK